MFYDLEDPNRFAEDVAEVLAPDGVWVVQQNYLATMLELNGFDNIGHEHLEYYSLGTMQELLKRHDLEVFDVETNEVNGGSFRTFICHKGRHSIQNSISMMRKNEERLALDSHATYEGLEEKIRKISSQVRGLVFQEVKAGKRVTFYADSIEANTFLNSLGL